VKEAWNSLLKRLQTADERLSLNVEVEDHFPATQKNNTVKVVYPNLFFQFYGSGFGRIGIILSILFWISNKF
jgi:hypothetical protein